ncbi:MAG TPA: DNA recombination protein RmuC [Candidatus Paceibacterota bacterium]|nr:DNA recombination protein RmuC [Candidatus Paceibacterota bacterium]
MELFEIVVIGLLLIIGGVVCYALIFRKEKKVEGNSEGLLLLQQQLRDLTRTMDARMGETTERMYESLERQSKSSQQLVKDIRDRVEEQLMGVVKGVTEVTESSKQVFTVAEQLKQLQDVLKNPKQRGVLGEYYLEAVLQNVLPPGSFQMQYAFANGEIVDAVVFVKDKVIPIDSKFSLENYNRYVEARDPIEKVQLEKQFVNDLKMRIQETAKYIRPSEKTTDFAFMFIPSEGIYYELLSNTVGGGEENLIQRSAGKYKVIIVSPTSFLAYLQTVLQGLKALEIEEKAIDIIKNVEKLGVHIGKYEEYYKKLGSTLATTVNHYNAGYKELGKIDKDVTRITGATAHIDPMTIDKPNQEI